MLAAESAGVVNLGSEVGAGCVAGVAAAAVGVGEGLVGEAERTGVGTAAGAGAGAGADAGTGVGAAADLVGLAVRAGVADTAAVQEATLPPLLTPLPVSKLIMFLAALLASKNSLAVSEGSALGAGGKMSD